MRTLHFRPLWTSDLVRIDEIYRKFYANQFSLPGLANTIGSGVISDNSSQVIAFGLVRLIPEAIIILDKDKPTRDKVEALKLLYEEAISACKIYGYKELYAKTEYNDFSRLLVRHFGFNYLNGKPMICHLGD